MFKASTHIVLEMKKLWLNHPLPILGLLENLVDFKRLCFNYLYVDLAYVKLKHKIIAFSTFKEKLVISGKAF